jgi:hypothetical protein
MYVCMTKVCMYYVHWEAAVAQRLSGENEKINEIERPRVRSPPRATSLKKDV